MKSKVQKTKDLDLVQIEKELSSHDPKVFEGIPAIKKEKLLQSFALTVSKMHVGPLPDPETLTHYSELIPNGAERIMQMAEKEQSHRHKLEQRMVFSQLRQSSLGQILAFLIGVIAFSAATFVIVKGYQWPGGVIGVGAITALVTAFIKGKSYQERK